MSYLGPCDACKAGNHAEHEHLHHTPEEIPGVFICGGGICQCQGECESESLD